MRYNAIVTDHATYGEQSTRVLSVVTREGIAAGRMGCGQAVVR